LERKAVIYVRQSTPQQVIEHRESTQRQYALVDRAVALGWAHDQVDIVDDDQGMSGQSVEGRLGFQRILAEVGLDRVGLILGLEMSRLARSNKDWHHLLELCAIFRVVLGDQDGLYDPTDFNDRLLLGLKGTMSEAELHILKGRMHQGRLNKADRGELMTHAPIGYVLNADKTGFELDPEEQAQEVVRLVFAEFQRQGTVYSLLRYLSRNEILLPVRSRSGSNRGQLEWNRPNRTTLSSMLHHPIYAGAYRYGYRYHDPRKKVAGRRTTGIVRIPLEECRVLIKDRFPAYITWEQFEANRQKMAENQSRAQSMGAPRSGPSLLGGLVYCGRCGNRLMVQYSGRASRLRYQCARNSQNLGEPLCQGIVGYDLDNFIIDRVFKVLEPASLELCLAATDDLEQERRRLDQHWQKRVERAAHKTGRAARQYQAVEPENRLVARTLEKSWEESLREQEKLQMEYEDFQRTLPTRLSSEQRSLVQQLSQDIPSLWKESTTTPQDRQQIVRMLIERIELNIEGNTQRTEIAITWAGGFVSRHQHNRVVSSYSQLSNLDELLGRIVVLKETGITLSQIAEQINEEGYHSLKGRCFTSPMLSRLLVQHGVHLPRGSNKKDSEVLKLHEWWLQDLAHEIGMPPTSLSNWHHNGWVNGRKLPGVRGRWILWADASEVDRLKQLRAARRRWSDRPYPTELTTPKPKQPDAS
jgi:DNA invertase Pin-like site-specific DNA recombinase